MSYILEEALKNINSKCIKINEDIRKQSVRELEALLKIFIDKMVDVDPLFNALYQSLFYCGSYYDNLKVGAPDEFDIDLLLKLPKLTNPTIICENNHPGFVSTELTGYHIFEKQTGQFSKFKDLKKTLLDDNNYLDNQKANRWMQSIVDKVLSSYNFKNISKCSKGKPAITLKVEFDDGTFDVDLVPCIVFDGDEWPEGDFKKPDFNNLQFDEKKFFIVPKPNKFSGYYSDHKLWRLSFQIQERRMLKFRTERLKPAIKLLKYLRDLQNYKSIKSYYIKTLGLWLIDNNMEVNNSSWSKFTLGEIFIQLLKDLQKSIENKNIKYYWDKHFNLLSSVDAVECDNISNNLKKIIKKLEYSTSCSDIYEIFKCSDIMNTPQSSSAYAVDSLTNDSTSEATVSGENIKNIALVAGAAVLGFSLYKYYSRRQNE